MRKKYLAAALAAGISLSALAVPLNASAESLWSDNGGGRSQFFSDHKACNVGDILTIIINESTSTSNNKSMKNSKDSSTNLNAGVGIFSFLTPASASASDSFNAKGSASNTNSAKARVTVTVVEVQPNGNMIIEGTQSIWQNRDENRITVRGVVRRDDVSYNNTVLSTQVADATIRFNGKGPLNAKQHQGIISQIFNFLF